jgi:hypothetical protein
MKIQSLTNLIDTIHNSIISTSNSAIREKTVPNITQNQLTQQLSRSDLSVGQIF